MCVVFGNRDKRRQKSWHRLVRGDARSYEEMHIVLRLGQLVNCFRSFDCVVSRMHENHDLIALSQALDGLLIGHNVERVAPLRLKLIILENKIKSE